MENRVIPLSEPIVGAIEQKYLRRCIKSGFVSSAGPMIEEFERKFAAHIGVGYAIAVTSGTAAIHVVLKALGVGAGHSVVVPDLTFVASMNPVIYCGGDPELVDVCRDTWCIDPELLEAVCQKLVKEGRKPSAIIPVHLYGSMCDMLAIRTVAKRFGIKIVEDATEALGSKLNGRCAGSFGDAGCFSFNGNKLITTGAGGMVVTDSAMLARKIRMLVNQAKSSNEGYIHERVGFNYRMSNIAAALGLAQTERMQGFLKKKRAIAKRYKNSFIGLSSLRLFPESKNVESSYWMYSVLLSCAAKRNLLIHKLAECRIQARKFFPPLHCQPYMQTKLWAWKGGICTKCNRGESNYLAQRGMNLPSCPSMTVPEQEMVIRRVREVLCG